MKLQDSSISCNETPLISMPPESESPDSKNADKAIKKHREFSWKIATNLLISFRYAWAGLSYAFLTQRNFRIHTIVGSVAIALSIFLGLKPIEIGLIGLTIGLVMGMELLNTAIESVVDLSVGQTYHELAKIAKDCAAAAVLVSALVSVLVAGLLLFPPLLELIKSVK
ncbi:MAG: diacylglycerol kinase family protein [Okeania sp. SIO2H7]|nr:diacylglycerol kinase family protein [Okeania sp. SIO2H7]